MSEHCGYIVRIEHIRKHNNADRLQIATFFGNDTIVSLDAQIGEIGVYFPVDLQLSEEFCAANNLVRKKDDAGNNIGGYLDQDKRNIRAIKLRGEKSDGLYLPLSCFNYLGNVNLNVGDTVDVIDGHEICRKYIPVRRASSNDRRDGNRTRKKKAPIAPLFLEHADTEQLAYNLNAFKEGDLIEITLKIHGTSQRTGYLPVLKKYKRSILDWILRREGKPVYDWGYVSGTRRTVLESYDGGYYGSNEFREEHSKFFEGKLHKGETVYYEVVGFQTSGAPIMSSVENSKTGDKEFIKKYGKTTIFSYGCTPNGRKFTFGQDDLSPFCIEEVAPISDAYVYRMTMTNEDGDVVEYTPDYMRYRCEQMGVKTVPVFWKGYIPKENELPMAIDFNDPEIDSHTMTAGEWVQELAEQFYDGTDPIGKTHVREGVVIRIVNKPKFTAYKHKNFNFKCLEGIAKNDADVPDIEEAEELNDSES